MAQDNSPAGHAVAAQVDVPVRSVSLFSSGVGYFQHLAQVRNNAQAELIFQTDQVNDILKSLVMQDLNGGQIGTVSYPSMDPLGRTLKGFAINLTDDPSMAGLLGQLRGAEVRVETLGGDAVAGVVVSVESREVSSGNATKPLNVSVLNLLTPQGLKAVRVDDARAIKLADPKLQEELTKALAAVARARDEEKKAIRFDFLGQGERQVKIGYVLQTPVWKTSYRLVLDDTDNAKANLQGWAIVENQTDNDWNNITLNLVSGRPLSFAMDLYTPMYLDRPEAQLEQFAGLRPQVYAQGIVNQREAAKREVRDRGEAPGTPRPALSMQTLQSSTIGNEAGERGIDPTSSVVSRASAGQLGELFQYTVLSVTLPRQSSAIIPIVTDPIEVKKLSIYNPAVHATHPLTGARINNTTGKNLLQGPITVFAGGGYAGDAQINNVPPGQARLISYGIDLQTVVDATRVEADQSIVTGKIVNGLLELSVMREDARTYAITNKSQDSKTVLIESPRLPGYELHDSSKSVETTDQLHRFEVVLNGEESKALVVKQRQTYGQSFTLVDMDTPTLLVYARSGTIPAKVRDALVALSKQREGLELLRQKIQEIDQRFEAIAQDQDRIRRNMDTVDRNTDYYKRLLTRLNEQEDQMDKGRIERDDLARQLEQSEAAFRRVVADLDAD